jgi:hypothetical protein
MRRRHAAVVTLLTRLPLPPPHVSKGGEAIAMSQAVVVLLEQARANRRQAERAKRLAGNITTRDAVRSLLDYAQELERLAVEAEERAFALIKAMARTQAPSADIESLPEEDRHGERRAKPQATNVGAADGAE